MSKFSKFKLVSCGFVAGALFFSGVSFAASNIQKIEAVFGIKVIQNNIDKTPTTNKPFTSKGTTYVPLRLVADMFAVPVVFDAKKNAVIVGEKTEGIPAGTPNSVFNYVGMSNSDMVSSQLIMIGNKSYGKEGFKIYDSFSSLVPTEYVELTYSLEGKYSKMVLGIGIDDYASNKEGLLRNIEFKDGDSVIHRESLGYGGVKEGITIDITNVKTLSIVITGSSSANLAFINPVFVK